MTPNIEAAVDAAAEAMSSTVPNQDGVLWMFDEVVDQRTGMTQPRPVTLTDAARAAITAALPALTEMFAQEIEAITVKDDVGERRDAEMMRDRAASLVRALGGEDA